MILMYHKIGPEILSPWWVDVSSFYRQLHALKCRNVVYLDDYDPADPEQVVITFDGIYRNVWQYAAPVLKHFGYPYELFVTSDYIGRDNAFDAPEPLAEFASMAELSLLVESGGRLQWHSRQHVNMKDIGDAELIAHELEIPEELRRLDPAGFNWFAYPHGEYSPQLLDSVKARFTGALSCHQGSADDIHRLNRITAMNDSAFHKHKISVIVASYNYGAFLAEALESVLRQTILPDEILISDDASIDNSREIALEFQRRHPDLIRVNFNETNLGIVGHFNRAVTLTKGDYVCILGADNRLRSDFLEQTVARLDADDKAAVAYTDFALFGPRAMLLADKLREQWPVRAVGEKYFIVQFPEFDAASRKLLDGNVNFIHGSSLFRRKAFDAIGGYQENSGIAEDYNLFARMMKAGWTASHCPAPLLEYRQHSPEQANVRLASEVELQFYKDSYRASQAELARMGTYMAGLRDTWAWKFATPVRVAENLVKRLAKSLRDKKNDQA